jgi:D-amino-acid dehydrogenase
MNLECDVLVIGGGITGVTLARELQSRGRQVRLLERSRIGQACSLGNAGWVTPCFAMPLPQPGMLLKSLRWLLDSSSPLYIHPAPSLTLARWLWRFGLSMNRRKMLRSIEVLTAVSKHSLEFYSELASRSPKSLAFEKRGLLMVSSTDAGLASARSEMELMARQQIPGRWMERDELLSFEPVLRPMIRGGVYFPEEAQIDPLQATLAVANEFKALGGIIHEDHEVFDIELGPKAAITRVRSTQGDFKPALVVLASGSWSPSIVRRLGLSVPILGGKGYSMTLNAARAPSTPIMIVERKIAVTPFPGKLRVAGTLELVDQDMGISPGRVAAIHRGAHEYLDLTGNENTQAEAHEIWRGLRPCTPDGVPIVGGSSRISNLFYCTGHQMLGLQSAPGTARLAADLISGTAPLTDPAPFSARRFE